MGLKFSIPIFFFWGGGGEKGKFGEWLNLREFWGVFLVCDPFFTSHLQYKHPGTFANLKYEELSYPRKSENVTPSSGTSPLASYQRKYTSGGLVSLHLIGFSLAKQ